MYRGTLSRGLVRRYSSSSATERFWKWTSQSREHKKYSSGWWTEGLIICTVFAVTGSSSLMFVRPALRTVGVEGDMWNGPWSYRIASLLIVTPIYSLILLTVGTLAGRHKQFAKQTLKIWGRVLPKKVCVLLLLLTK